jgi:glycolate oxidase FAD binding subunit
MDLMVSRPRFEDVRAQVVEASVVAPVGGRTHWEVGGPPPCGDEVAFVAAPAGVVTYDPADLTVTVGAGIPVGELAQVLAERGQECALDPRSPVATVGGVLAVGLSGFRRLRHGPLRDRVLEVQFVTADGRVVKGGGPTVKNVSGFDLPRLLIGSFGTIGVLVQATLRCQPQPVDSVWCSTDADPFALHHALYRPACVAWDGTTTQVLLEGDPTDIADQRAHIPGVHDREDAPAWPDGRHRGRVSVRPSAVRHLAPALDAHGVRWLAEVGVGTVHVATDDEASLAAVRETAHAAGGWMLREAGAPGLDGFGVRLPNAQLAARVRAAFDPAGKCSPRRLPIEPPDG